jgi:hypothetical protein
MEEHLGRQGSAGALLLPLPGCRYGLWKS